MHNDARRASWWVSVDGVMHSLWRCGQGRCRVSREMDVEARCFFYMQE
jgi:hypothetical protein